MILEIHDTETGNTLNGRVKDLDYDYMAEQWVQELAPMQVEFVRFVLMDDVGERAVWEKPESGATSVKLVSRSPRFTGEWQVGTEFTWLVSPS